ncbi:sugar ABC transporter ATP-binding protein [Tianweitania populi]|uniref:Sugar ABC transporter ATP-binding protein n=1 Tax=Tianweitania populi TaxID=1607949 RepID=A0A8J3GKS9_9HYPH|nr:sugar ABC transporter ATP-binding protein [Tianweitania populi]GHD13878.1 sugar ABC transporter ATP-binding protein [Tianweitania populi]
MELDAKSQPAAAPGQQRARSTPFLEVRNLHKRYGGVHALRGVSFSIERGQTYHLLGENGCGKSTLIKILSGAQPSSEGDLVIDGTPRKELDPIRALQAGIETVYQDLSLLPNLSVEENIGLTQQLVEGNGRLFRPLHGRRLRETAKGALAKVGLPTDNGFLSSRIEDLPIATRQLVAIARAIAGKAGLVIMDEPTTSLTRREVENLISVVRTLHADGVSVLFVTHKLDECKEIGGRAIVMRDGEMVRECDISEASKRELGQWMTGRELEEGRYRENPQLGDTLLQVADLSRDGRFADVSFSVAKGEILGITGLLDSGRNELALALAGVVPADSGEIRLGGERLSLPDPASANAAGVGYVPEDRLTEGLFLEKPIEDNVVMAILNRLRNMLGLVDRSKSAAVAGKLMSDLKVVAPNIKAPVQSLSGGNQQRVLIGRWLAIEPRLLILHGPTVGVDVGSKDTIFRIIQGLADTGMAVILISDDLPELLQNCDRIAVMQKGRVVATQAAESLTETALYELMGAAIRTGDAAGKTA